MMLMYARNAVGAYRTKLAQGEWFRCPSCGGRGLWVDEGGTNRYCSWCSGTGILLVCEQDEPKPAVPAREGWWSWLRKQLHLAPRKNVGVGRRS